ncbi:MAG: metal-dependent hydrolase [Candidatus Babeliales bacterium]
MPGYKQHLCGGIAVYGLTCGILHKVNSPLFVHADTPFFLLEWLTFALAGSLFPDVDIKSKGQQIYYWIISLVTVLLILYGNYKAISIVAVAAAVPPLATHRGIFHRTWFILGLTFLGAYFGGQLYPCYAERMFIDAAFFSIGALSHVWLDSGFQGLCKLW